MSLNTLAGSRTADSYITLEELEEILVATGMVSPAWNSLNQSAAFRCSTAEAGPYTFIEDVTDTVSFTVGTGSAQVVTLTGTNLNALLVATQINDSTTGINAVPTLSNTIDLYTVDYTKKLTINAAEDSAYTVLGLTVGEYESASLDAQKEYLLMLSALLIGRLPLKGKRVYTGQALDFPRTSQSDVTEIPDAVKEAQAIIASMVILPNMQNHSQWSSDLNMPSSLRESSVSRVQVAGIMTVDMTSSSNLLTQASLQSSPVNLLLRSADVYCLPVYLRMRPYLSQFKGGVINSIDDFNADLLEAVD